MNKQPKSSEPTAISHYILLFITISFIGWLYESILRSIITHSFVNTGFLFIPLTPIYGFSIVILYLLFGTPKQPRLFSKSLQQNLPKFSKLRFYFIIAALMPTFLELITGLFFDQIYHIRLWDYTGWPLNFNGYICLLVSLFWGVLITLFMGLVFDPFFSRIKKVPLKTAKIISIIVILIILIDFINQFILLHLGLR